MPPRAYALLPLALLAAAGAQERSIIEWSFAEPGELHGWVANDHLADVKVADGALGGRTVNWDPFFTSPVFDIPARPWQTIELVLRSDKGFDGQIFWSNTLQSQYAGFFPDRNTPFHARGGGQWETIRISPYWQAEKKIVHLRLDLADGCTFAVRSIKVVEPAEDPTLQTSTSWDFTKGAAGWSAMGLGEPESVAGGTAWEVAEQPCSLRSPRLGVELGDRYWVALRMRTRTGRRARLEWATAERNGLSSQAFDLRPDGLWHTYNLDVGGQPGWRGQLLALGLVPTNEARDTVEVASLAIVEDPVGGPDLEVTRFGLDNAINRAGKPCVVSARVLNHGGENAVGVKATLSVPAGVKAVPLGPPAPELEFGIPGTYRWTVTASKPGPVDATVRFSGPGAPAAAVAARLEFTASPPGAARSGYVPEPHPAQTKYLIGTYYFPRWFSPNDWECIDRVAPIRKPVLGWYDESKPEIVDWQIKWAVEHGVNLFLVDWYWSAGSRNLEQWLHQGYMHAKYRKFLKWAVMWANHNAPNTHSREDWINVTQWWIDHYFAMPEYQRMDGKPVVYIWAPTNISRDVGGTEKARELLDLSQEMARKAGYPGIVFAAMNVGDSPQSAKDLVAMGYTVCTTYHWWSGAERAAPDYRYFPYSTVVDRARETWEARREVDEAAGLKFLPVADSGWDSRPWHGDSSMVIHDRTVPEWERLLREAKGYLDAHQETTLVLGPWNEWGEGSYLEPCAEWGFGMVEAVRRVFCDPGPAHTDVAPTDVGLGPYDIPLYLPGGKAEFDFATGLQGWTGMMGLRDVGVADGALHAVTNSTDPAFRAPNLNLRASQHPNLTLRMKLSRTPSGKDGLQIFFATPTQGESEANSVKTEVIADGEYHTYVLPMSANPRWRGVIRAMRLDPCSSTGVEVWIDEARLGK
ncbi:MAG: glycoside hydrolase family 99-like domain-containing protein [Armatimonadetes bacterium]|nr:glycoside hydrolase family 99-like domain-containing protein [Armatimonadota bacterium]